MQNHLADSTAAYKAGLSLGKRIFKIPAGEYSGRIVALLPTAPGEVKLSFSDYPYTLWSTPAVIISDCADYPFDAVMDGDGNILVAYTLVASHDLVLRELAFSGGGWSPGSLNTIYDGDDNYFPSLVFEPGGRLWVSWSRLSASQYYINAKYSDDRGVTWAGGSSSPGTTLSAGAADAYSKIFIRNPCTYCLYSLGGTTIAFRKKHFNVTLWDAEENVAAGTGYDHNFDAAVSDDGKIGVAYDDGMVRFREYDGNSWNAITVIDDDGGSFPQVKYFDNCPYIVYLSSGAVTQNRLLYSGRNGSTFSLPALLDPRKNQFSKVLCYRATGGTYRDLTTAAASADPADVFHSDSGVMFKETGDSLYLGLDDRFHYVKILLSTAGSGGLVSWQYYDGQDWVEFVPSGGAFHFDSSDRELLLWDDYSSIPTDWQKKTVDGVDKFWIRAIVLSPCTVGPIGTQLTSYSNISGLVLLE